MKDQSVKKMTLYASLFLLQYLLCRVYSVIGGGFPFQNNPQDLCDYFGLNHIYFKKLSHTNVQNQLSGFGRKIHVCKDHLPDHLQTILEMKTP